VLYAARASAASPVQAALLHQLRRAAEDEVSGASEGDIYGAARDALAALEVLLSERPGGWFFGGVPSSSSGVTDEEEEEKVEERVEVGGPTFFDASVFAYTHLLLDDRMGWVDRRLPTILEGFPALVAHRTRLLERCWGGQGSSAAVEDSALWEKI